MKVAIGSLLRATAKPVIGSLAVAALLVGCGDKESDPDAVSVEDLKYPGALKIVDNGNGAVKLWWTGSNNEDDFDGYNVYGMKDTGTFGLTEGDSLQFLDEAGEPIQAAKDILAKFNYDPATGLESVGTGAAAANAEGEEPEFSALPIHTKAADGETRYLPTCMHTPDAQGVCSNTTEATAGKSVSDGGTMYAVNGPISYDVSGLKVGSKYCFLVLSSMDGGTKVSSTSSNFECVTPNHAVSFTMPVPSAGNFSEFKVADLLAACDAGDCGDGATHFADTGATGATKNSEGVIYAEFGGGSPQWVAGKYSSVIDLGYSTGFGDALLPAKAPTYVIDEDNLISGGGYAVAGQSVPLVASHMYVIAQGDSSGDATQTTFKYHWVYVKDEAGSVEMRLQK